MTNRYEPTAAEKLAVLHNSRLVKKAEERKEANTFFAAARRDLGLDPTNTGTRAATVSGEAPTVRYPRLPPSSPWGAPDPVPPEPPLGFSVSEPIVCGEVFEQERSLSALANPTDTMVASPPSVGPATGTAQATEDVPVAPIPKTPTIRRRSLK
jgi:hypothetical protein